MSQFAEGMGSSDGNSNATGEHEPPPVIEIVDGAHRWRFDREFFASGWECIWGDGCVGILSTDATDAQTGCCSVGVELIDEDEAMLISALAACLPSERFANVETATQQGIFADDSRKSTLIVAGACIFFNAVDSEAPTGCALHHEAVAQGESPIDWKPWVCWQVPIRVDSTSDGDGESHYVRAWTRDDWGDEGSEMVWWCTEHHERDPISGDFTQPDAYRSESSVAIRLQREITELAGPKVAGALRERLDNE